MSLKNRIISFLEQKGIEVSLQELYKSFPEIARTTIRGRVYESVGKGIEKVGEGLYISYKAIMEQGNALEIIDRMIEEGDKFKFIFLDIPYEAAGQRGGNRNLFECDKISPEQFGEFIRKCEHLLEDEKSLVAFMFTTGKTSKSAHDKYLNEIKLKRCDVLGTYKKLWPNGNPMNMGKYLMPVENIYFFSKSGKIAVDTIIPDLNFALTPDIKEYPTSKPYEMIKTLVNTFTKIGDWVFDPFAGSGKILKACMELGRKCHVIDISKISFENHLSGISIL